ncbi:NAD(P)-dependent oxidoreductase [Furfurilactobacillus entadae]|uniref:NAD(P)-dependent oxidoreductase n=1 Tax=Furfurilactobacillus entadae TaxID=2922307 RepID=UPI0038B3AA2C
MMKVAIFGATGSVGHHLIDESVRQGHEVVAVSRHEHPTESRKGVSWKRVDYEDVMSLVTALAGSDAVIISLGDDNIVTPTKNITLAMKQTGMTRVELLTGFGTSPESRKQLSLGMRAVMMAMHPILRTKEKQDHVVRARADLAEFMITNLTNHRYSHDSVYIQD